MKIAVLANTYEPTFGENAGGNVHFLHVVRRCTAHEVTIFGPREAREAFLQQAPNACYVDMPSFPWVRNTKIELLLRALAGARRRRELRAHDAILATSHFIADVIPAIVAASGKTAVIVWHVLPPFWKRGGNVLMNAVSYWSEKVSLALIRRYVPVRIVGSRWLARESNLEVGARYMTVTTNGIDHADTGHTVALTERAGCLYVGRMHHAKGVEDVIRAWGKVPAHLRSAKLYMAGDGPSWYMAHLQELAASLGVAEDIVFLGRVSEEEKWRRLHQSSVFLFASTEEGWGIALAEAMSAGLPCITYDLPVYNEIFRAGRVSVKEGDVREFGARIATLLSNDAERTKLAAAALAQSRHFTWDEAARIELEALAKAAG